MSSSDDLVAETKRAKQIANTYIGMLSSSRAKSDNKFCLESYYKQAGFGSSEQFYAQFNVEQVDNLD